MAAWLALLPQVSPDDTTYDFSFFQKEVRMALTVRPLAQSFAAEVRGLDLRQAFDKETFAELYDLFLTYGVVVLPGQAVSVDQHLDFASHFGEIWTLPVDDPSKLRVKNAAIDDVSNLDAKGEIAGTDSEKYMFALGNQLWHSDLSFRDVPAQASLLHAEEIALDGGETEFSDLIAAYDALPEDMRTKIDGLVAQHSLLHSRQRMGYSQITDEQRAKFPPAFQPLVRVHPDTGKKNLYIGAHAFQIEGVPAEEGEALLDHLLNFATEERFVYRHRWAVYDLVIWDNRRVLHRGRPYDADRERRVMHRVTIQGKGKTVENGQIVVGM